MITRQERKAMSSGIHSKHAKREHMHNSDARRESICIGIYSDARRELMHRHIQ